MIKVTQSSLTKRNNDNKTLTKHVPRKNHFVTEILSFATANTFFQLILVYIANNRTGYSHSLKSRGIENTWAAHLNNMTSGSN